MDTANMAQSQKAKIAVGYFASRIDEAPEEARKFIEKINKYSSTANKCEKTMDEAKSAYDQMQEMLSRSIGAIDALTDIVSDILTPEQIEEAASKFEPQIMNEEEKK